MEGITELLKSNNVEIRVVDGKGRCLFLTQPAKKGDTIFEEDCLISCQYAWNKAYNYRACEFCLRPLESIEENVLRLSGNKFSEIPFLECDPTKSEEHRCCESCGEEFCCESCRQNALKQYHRILCPRRAESEPLGQLIEKWKEIHGPPESLNILMLAKILTHIHTSADSEKVYNLYMQFCHQTVNEDQNLMHALLQEKFRCNIDELWPLVSTAMLTVCPEMSTNPFVSSLLTREGFITMLSLIGRNGQGIGTSVLAQWAKLVLGLSSSPESITSRNHLIDEIYKAADEYVSSDFLDNEGTALYVIQSCINHSCSPNSKIKFPYNNTRLAVVAKKDLSPGEEVLISYVDRCTSNRSCHTRRNILRNYYLFNCCCEKCIHDSAVEPDITSEEEDDDDEDME